MFQWLEEAKQTLKTVEKSIDKAIGIPAQDGAKDPTPQPQSNPPASTFWWGEGDHMGITASYESSPPPTLALSKKPVISKPKEEVRKHSSARKLSTEDLSLEQLLNNDALLESLTPQKRPASTPKQEGSPSRALRTERGDPAARAIRKAKKMLEDTGEQAGSPPISRANEAESKNATAPRGETDIANQEENTSEVAALLPKDSSSPRKEGETAPAVVEPRVDNNSGPLQSETTDSVESSSLSPALTAEPMQNEPLPVPDCGGKSDEVIPQDAARTESPRTLPGRQITETAAPSETVEESIEDEENQDVEKEGVPIEGSAGTHDPSSEGEEVTSDNTSHIAANQQDAKIILELQDKLHMLSLTLAEREKQLSGAAQANSMLQEAYNKLEGELREKEAKEREIDAEGMKKEFSTRLGQLERSLGNVMKERDALKRQLAEANPESVIKEKDETIAILRAEGEKLSKTQLKLEAVVKKLRAEEKSNAKLISTLQERLSTAENLIEVKNEQIKELEATHSQYSDTIHTMKEVSESTAKKLEEQDRITLNSQHRVAELEGMLNKAWEEISDYKKQLAVTAEKSEASIAASKEAASLHYEALMRKIREEASAQEASLSMTIHQLRSTVARDSERALWREEEFRKEIHTLQMRLQAAEERNEELAASVPDTTRPLLRQIETLQALMASKQRAWEDLEASLVSRLKEQEERSASSLDKERKASALLAEKTARVASLESKLSIEQSATIRITSELEAQRGITEETKKQLQVTELQLESLRHQYNKLVIEKQKNEEKYQATILEVKEQGQAYLAAKEREWKEKEDKRAFEKERANMYSTITLPHGGGSPSSWKSLPSSAALEGLHAALKQKDGEIANLQALLASADKQKCNLEDELVLLTSKNEELTLRVKQLSGLQGQIEELNKRYETALELMGEKAEMVEELQADLKDMKELYRNQVSDLLLKIEVLEKANRGGKA